LELSLLDDEKAQQAITDELEEFCRETGNVIGKGVSRCGLIGTQRE